MLTLILYPMTGGVLIPDRPTTPREGSAATGEGARQEKVAIANAAGRDAGAGRAREPGDRYAKEGVRTNNVLPGFVDSFEVDEEIRRSMPAGRPSEVAEIATTVALLLSPDASYLTGQNVRADGGLTRSV